jgi:hypothetical protein
MNGSTPSPLGGGDGPSHPRARGGRDGVEQETHAQADRSSHRGGSVGKRRTSSFSASNRSRSPTAVGGSNSPLSLARCSKLSRAPTSSRSAHRSIAARYRELLTVRLRKGRQRKSSGSTRSG